MKTQRKRILCHTVTDYILTGNQDNETLYLLLHGFNETGEKMVKRVSNLLPEDSLILAPNGNFPLPEKSVDGGYNVKFAWYFFDNTTNSYFIDYDLPSEILINLIKALGFDGKKLIIIGYSQGGYLAPFVGLKSNKTTKVIGMACVFRHKLFDKTPNFPLIGIHGKNDLMVSLEGAKKSIEEMKSSHFDVTFLELVDSGHRFDHNFEKALGAVL